MNLYHAEFLAQERIDTMARMAETRRLVRLATGSSPARKSRFARLGSIRSILSQALTTGARPTPPIRPPASR
jgi:hypothetical protein